MIRPLAAFLHALDAARTAGTLSRTVLVLSRQLDNAHLLAASEGARADREEAERDHAEAYAAQLEASIRDWEHDSGADDPLPDLTDAGEAPIPLVLTDSAREAEIQRDRADALQRALQACEVDLAKLREAKLAADIRADVQRERAEQAERERDTNARAAGAHIATINDLRARLDLALRAVHRPAAEPPPIDPPCQCGHRATVHGREGCEAIIDGPGLPVCPCERFQVYGCRPRPAEQIPGVAAACGDDDDPPTCDACGKPARDGDRTGEAEAVLLCSSCHQQARAEESS